MSRCCALMAFILAAGLGLAAGCGRPTLPGQQFKGERVRAGASERPTSPVPEEPYFELGPAAAKVRIIALFPIDEERQPLMDLLKSVVDEHPGRVYLIYADYRTREGRRLQEEHEMVGTGLVINGESRVQINAEPESYTVDFVHEMGRYWLAEDLRKAVAQKVEEAYGEGEPTAK